MRSAERKHPTQPEWRWQALCAASPRSDVWYSSDLGDIASAQAICMDCQVRQDCLLEGLDDEHGVWGGYTPSERARLLKYLPTAPSARTAALTRAAYVGPALFGVADTTHPLRIKEK